MYIISFKIVYTETSGKVFLEGCKLEVKFTLIWLGKYLLPIWSIDLGITKGFGGCAWFDWALGELLQDFDSLSLFLKFVGRVWWHSVAE